jgi:hypothetical protein
MFPRQRRRGRLRVYVNQYASSFVSDLALSFLKTDVGFPTRSICKKFRGANSAALEE